MNSPRLQQHVDRDRLLITGVKRKLHRPLIGLTKRTSLAGIRFKQHCQSLLLTF